VRVILFLLCAIVAARLVHIQLLSHKKYVALAEEQYLREYVKKALRGRIYDRKMVTVALNKPSYDLGLDIRNVEDADRTARKIAAISDLSYTEVYTRIKSRKNFVYLRRNITEQQAAIFRGSAIAGIRVLERSERNYPMKEKLAQVLGFVNVDGHGLSGIELKLNDILKGRDGWSIQQKDAKGNSILPVQAATQTTENGQDVILTIDNIIQAIADEELEQAVKHFNAKSGSVVITNPRTGEILAMASVPGFDPNATTRADSASWRNRCITDIFEPGSTFKFVTLLAALQDSIKTANDIIYCENGRYKLFGETIRDSEKHGWLSVRNILKYSSNIGIAKIALEVGKERLFRTARSFGFGLKTGIELPGEVSGILRKPKAWSAFSVAAIAYGHEVAVTPLQMAMAYGAIANGGKLMKPAIVKQIVDATGKPVYHFEPTVIREVMRPQLAQAITNILEEVVESGTGVKARIANHRIAGKTGTAQKLQISGRGYSNSRYMASFAGYYPADDAKYLIFINIDEPFPTHSGGSVAAPTFRKMLTRILDVYGEVEAQPAPLTTQLRELPKPSRIPELRGRNVETAIKLLNEQGVSFKIIGDGAIVLRQALRTQGEGADLLVVETTNPPVGHSMQIMPDLVGLSVRQAISECALRGLKVKIFGSGDVIRQKPASGSKIKSGAQCMLECRPSRRLHILGRTMVQQPAVAGAAAE